jgi:hypothetical protein
MVIIVKRCAQKNIFFTSHHQTKNDLLLSLLSLLCWRKTIRIKLQDHPGKVRINIQ